VARRIECLEQREQVFGRDDGVEGNPQLGFPAIGDALDASFQFAGGTQQVTTIIQQGAPGFVEGRSSPFAQEECDAQFAFQLGDGVR
jgi:hypothetical protein